MLVHHLRRWPNIEPTMGQCIVFAELNEPSTPVCFTHEGGERPMSLKLQNQLCKTQNRRVLVDKLHVMMNHLIISPVNEILIKTFVVLQAEQP